MNFPTTTRPTTFVGMGEKPGPTMKGWFSTGNEVADEMLAWGNVAADETLSWDDVVAMLAMDSECEGFGGKKVDTKVGTTKAGLPWAAEAPADVECAAKPAPEAAKAEACEDSSEGTPRKAITLDRLAVDKDWPEFGRAVEAGQGTEACSAAKAAFTACTTVARISGDG